MQNCENEHETGGLGRCHCEVDDHRKLEEKKDDEIFYWLGEICCEVGIACVEVRLGDFVNLLSSLAVFSHYIQSIY